MIRPHPSVKSSNSGTGGTFLKTVGLSGACPFDSNPSSIRYEDVQYPFLLQWYVSYIYDKRRDVRMTALMRGTLPMGL